MLHIRVVLMVRIVHCSGTPQLGISYAPCSCKGLVFDKMSLACFSVCQQRDKGVHVCHVRSLEGVVHRVLPT